MKGILINGVVKDVIDVADRGFQYGDGLFETMLCINGRIPLLDTHLKRLANGCQRLQIPAPDESLIRQEIGSFCENIDKKAVIKLMVTRGAGGKGYRPEPLSDSGSDLASLSNRIMMMNEFPENYDDLKKTGIRLHLCNTRISRNPDLAGIKHLNRLEQVLASVERDDAIHHEGLMCDSKNHIIEGTRMNLFIIWDGDLITPDISYSGVAGVFRELVINRAEELGINVKVCSIDKQDVISAEGVFMTNAIAGILPVASLEDTAWEIHDMVSQLNSKLPF